MCFFFALGESAGCFFLLLSCFFRNSWNSELEARERAEFFSCRRRRWKRSYAAGGHFIIPGRRRQREKRERERVAAAMLGVHNFCA